MKNLNPLYILQETLVTTKTVKEPIKWTFGLLKRTKTKTGKISHKLARRLSTKTGETARDMKEEGRSAAKSLGISKKAQNSANKTTDKTKKKTYQDISRIQKSAAEDSISRGQTLKATSA